MDIIKTRGRNPTNNLNDDDLVKQQKRHQYYLNFKSKHPLYYKKANAVGRPKKENPSIPETKLKSIPETKLNVIHEKIDEIINKLQELRDFNV
jgi:hypothetical protein